MNSALGIILLIVVVGVAVFYMHPDLFKKITDMLPGKSTFIGGPSANTDLQMAYTESLSIYNDALAHYGIKNHSENETEFMSDVARVQSHLLSKPESEYKNIAAPMYVHNLSKHLQIALLKYGKKEDADAIEGEMRIYGMAKFEQIFHGKIHENPVDIIINADPNSELSGKNVFKAIWKQNTNNDINDVRDAKEMDRMHRKKQKDVFKSKDNTALQIIGEDHPSLFNNNTLLPNMKPKNTNGEAINLDLENIVASQNRFYENGSQYVTRNRGGDDRPLPKALIDSVMTQGNSNDPNSLQLSAKFDVIDILETGRGISGNEYLDLAIDTYRDKTNPGYVKQIQQVSTIEKRQTGSLRDMKKSQSEIIHEIKNGRHQIMNL